MPPRSRRQTNERLISECPRAQAFLEEQTDIKPVPLDMRKNQFLCLALAFVRSEGEVPMTELKALSVLLRNKLHYSYDGTDNSYKVNFPADLAHEPRFKFKVVWTSDAPPTRVCFLKEGTSARPTVNLDDSSNSSQPAAKRTAKEAYDVWQREQANTAGIPVCAQEGGDLSEQSTIADETTIIQQLRSALEAVHAAQPEQLTGEVSFGTVARALEDYGGLPKMCLVFMATKGLGFQSPADALRKHCEDLVKVKYVQKKIETEQLVARSPGEKSKVPLILAERL